MASDGKEWPIMVYMMDEAAEWYISAAFGASLEWFVSFDSPVVTRYPHQGTCLLRLSMVRYEKESSGYVWG